MLIIINDSTGAFFFFCFACFSFPLLFSAYFPNGNNHSFESNLLQTNIYDITICYFTGNAQNMVPHSFSPAARELNVNNKALMQGFWFNNSGACQ